MIHTKAAEKHEKDIRALAAEWAGHAEAGASAVAMHLEKAADTIMTVVAARPVTATSAEAKAAVLEADKAESLAAAMAVTAKSTADDAVAKRKVAEEATAKAEAESDTSVDEQQTGETPSPQPPLRPADPPVHQPGFSP